MADIELEQFACRKLIALNVLVNRHFHVPIHPPSGGVNLNTRRKQYALVAAILKIGRQPAVVQPVGIKHLC